MPESYHYKVIEIREHETKSKKSIEDNSVNKEMLNRPHFIDITSFLFIFIDNIGDIIRTPRRYEVLLTTQSFYYRVISIEFVSTFILMTMLDTNAFCRNISRNFICNSDFIFVFTEKITNFLF